jgi:hypothetical protein
MTEPRKPASERVLFGASHLHNFLTANTKTNPKALAEHLVLFHSLTAKEIPRAAKAQVELHAQDHQESMEAQIRKDNEEKQLLYASSGTKKTGILQKLYGNLAQKLLG